MKVERVVNLCQRRIKKELAKPNPNKEVAEAYQEIIDYVKNYDKPEKDEVEAVQKIFNRHYVAYHKEVLKRNLTYSFSTREDGNTKKLIRQIKQHLAEETDKEISVVDFFDFFMGKYPDWWKENCFDINTIAKHFQKILTQIAKESSKHGGQQGKKPTKKEVFNAINNKESSEVEKPENQPAHQAT